MAGPAHAFPGEPGAEVIPWLDQLPENPVPELIVQQLDWEQLDSWQTPVDQHFIINHYGLPSVDTATWQLQVNGLVQNPLSLSLDDLTGRERQEVTYTMECSGNTGLPFFNGGIGNATWAGTPLAPILEEAGLLDDGIEVVFWGADAGEQTWREVTITEQFARSMSVADAMNVDNILAYEMNGEPLPENHGAPLRLIAPGWYGIANVKWLTTIEVRNARFQGHFMARDYVTIREEDRDGETVWTFTSVGHGRLKSAPAQVLRSGETYSIVGAAWGAPIAEVEVRIDDGDWVPATLSDERVPYAWVFWEYPWDAATAGEHTISSRAIDEEGNVQPPPDDPFLAGKTTFWESNGQITRSVAID